MTTVSALEAKTRFGQLLERVAQGEEIVITRHNRAVARLVPEGRTSLESVRKAVATLRNLQERISKRRHRRFKLSFGGFKAAVKQGRK